MTPQLLIGAILVLAGLGTLRATSPAPYQLDNGLTVILRPVPKATQVAVVVLFALGGDHDPAGKSGRAHLLEHLYCTAAAGETPARDFQQIQKRYGAGYNQQTGFDYTVLAGVVKAGQLEEEFRDTAARMSTLRITEADLERELPRVLNELNNMYGRIPSLAGLNHVRQQLHPIAQNGRHGGHAAHLETITLQELQQVWHDYYRPNNATLVVAGRFEAAAAKELIAKHFGSIKAGKDPPAKPEKPQTKTGRPKRLEVTPLARNARGVVSLGYAAPKPGAKNYPAFLLVVSRLYAQVGRGGFKPGMVPPLYYPPLDDPSTIALQANIPDGGDPQVVVKDLEQRLQTALDAKVSAAEKRTALQSWFMLGTIDAPQAMWAQNVYGLAFGAGRQKQLEINGKELAKAIRAVTEADLKRLRKEVFAPERRQTAIVEVQK